jgi:hypothetical protein
MQNEIQILVLLLKLSCSIAQFHLGVTGIEIKIRKSFRLTLSVLRDSHCNAVTPVSHKKVRKKYLISNSNLALFV